MPSSCSWQHLHKPQLWRRCWGVQVHDSSAGYSPARVLWWGRTAPACEKLYGRGILPPLQGHAGSRKDKPGLQSLEKQEVSQKHLRNSNQDNLLMNCCAGSWLGVRPFYLLIYEPSWRGLASSIDFVTCLASSHLYCWKSVRLFAQWIPAGERLKENIASFDDCSHQKQAR